MAAIMPIGTPISTTQIIVMRGEQDAGLGAVGDHRQDRRLKEDRLPEIAGERLRRPIANIAATIG